MKKSNDIVIWWARGSDKRDWYVVVHSKPLTPAASARALKYFQAEQYVRAIVPQIFLDLSLDTPAFRLFLREEATRRSKL